MPRAGCVETPCWPPMPDGCCPICKEGDSTDAADLAEQWPIAVEYTFHRTCCSFPGICDPVRVEWCFPKKCVCSPEGCCTCGCRLTEYDLGQALCYPIVRDEVGRPMLKFFSIGDDNLPGDEIDLGDGNWWVDDRNHLWVRDGHGFPGCRVMIEATIGKNPPPLVLKAAADLACELLKDCRGEESCLPDGVTSITRRGVSMNVDNSGPSETVRFDTGFTGVKTLDMAIELYGCKDEGEAHFVLDPLADDQGHTFLPHYV